MSIVEIPVLPHVKCLLIGIYGSEPLFAHEKNLLGKEIDHFTNEPEPPAPVIRCEKIKISISLRLKPRYNHTEALFSFGHYFEKVFHKLLHQHIIAQLRCKRSVKEAIRDFYALYDITENLYPIASAERSYYRFLEENKYTISVPRFPRGRQKKANA